MIQATSVNCSPIKPQTHQSFGNREVLAATADWLDGIEGDELTEDNFVGLQNVTEKLSDGPLKTFATILAIGGATFAAIKAGSVRVVKKVTDNPTIQKNVTRPLTKLVHNGIETLSTKIKSSKYFGETAKGAKSYILNSSAKALDSIKKYGERGSEAITKDIQSQITKLKSDLAKASEKKKPAIQEAIKQLQERKKYAATENLITKASTTTAATGAGTAAVVSANKDSNNDGIADIGQH